MHSAQFSRRAFVSLLGGALLGAAAQGAAAAPPSALRKGAAFLARAQGPDGAWRSAHYGFFRSGDALTPVILLVLGRGAESAQEHEAVARGGRWLDALTDRIGAQTEPWLGLRYPLFTASYAARYYAGRRDSARVAVWADCIAALQLTTRLGWPKSDPRHGGWCDAPMPPKRPAGAASVPDMLNPNLSATAFALFGLAAAGRLEHARAAEDFILRCQNLPHNPGATRDTFDDGGFFFALDDPARSKAGAAGRDATGKERCRSYGSATCDGILSLLALGHTAAHPRIDAALSWLRDRAAKFVHPGDWPSDRADSARALLYYYAQAMAQVASHASAPWISIAHSALKDGLSAKQAADGSWSNPDPESCEDDPLVATAFALHALAS